MVMAPPGRSSGSPKLEPLAPEELFVDHDALAPRHPVPGVGQGRQKRPVVAIGGVVGHAVDLARDGRGSAPRRSRSAARRRPAGRARRRIRLASSSVRPGDVKLGREALVQPAGEGEPEARHHRADADIGGERQQQRHQRQRQARQLLARVGPEPLGHHAPRQPRAKRRSPPSAQAAAAAPPPAAAPPAPRTRPKGRAEAQKRHRHRQQQRTRRALPAQRAGRGARPGAGLGGGEQRQAAQPPQALPRRDEACRARRCRAPPPTRRGAAPACPAPRPRRGRARLPPHPAAARWRRDSPGRRRSCPRQGRAR